MRDSGLTRNSATRGRGSILLIAQVLILENIVCVLSLKISWTRSNNGSVETGSPSRSIIPSVSELNRKGQRLLSSPDHGGGGPCVVLRLGGATG